MQVSLETSYRFLYSFWHLKNQLPKMINPKLSAQHNLDMAEVFLLRHIRDSDMSPSEIADRMQIPAHNISRKLDSLEKGGLIARALDPQDARRRVLTLTAAGKRTLESASKVLEHEVSSMLGALEPERLELFLSAMETLGCASTDASNPASQTAKGTSPSHNKAVNNKPKMENL